MSRPEKKICEIEGCDRWPQRRCGGLHVCRLHGFRFDRRGDFNADRKYGKPNRNKQKCSVDGCSDLEDGNAGMCKLHDTRRRRHGDPLRVIHQRDRNFPRGEKHHWWNAEGSYNAVHRRLRTIRGRASDYPCVTCSRDAAHWAYQHGDSDEQLDEVDGYMVPFSTNIDAYEPMCVPCHKRMDLERIGEKSEI